MRKSLVYGTSGAQAARIAAGSADQSIHPRRNTSNAIAGLFSAWISGRGG
ncbi:MAG: hypothetical protein ACK500_14495 [Flavobacteriales bacterium]